MKRYTPRSIAGELAKLPAKLQKAQKEVESLQSYRDYLSEQWTELPARIAELRAELQESEDRATEARADLTKPLESYRYDQNWRDARRENGPRHYASPLAQKAWDTERAAYWKRESLEEHEATLAAGESAWMQENASQLAAAESELSLLIAKRDNLIALASKIMGKPVTAESLAVLVQTPQPKKQDPESPVIELPARKVDESAFVVLAENIAGKLSKAKEFSVNGMTYFAKHVREWAHLEDGQITVTIGPAHITFRSTTARMTVKAQGDRPAPVMTFVTG